MERYYPDIGDIPLVNAPAEMGSRISRFDITVNTNYRAQPGNSPRGWHPETEHVWQILARTVQTAFGPEIDQTMRHIFSLDLRYADPVSDTYDNSVVAAYLTDAEITPEMGAPFYDAQGRPITTSGRRVHVHFTVEVIHNTFLRLDAQQLRDRLVDIMDATNPYVPHAPPGGMTRPFRTLYVKINGRRSDADSSEYNRKGQL